jgi:hypothetical protein
MFEQERSLNQGQTTFMAAKKKKSARQKPIWERAYQGHVLWLGKTKLGKVTLLTAARADARGKYRWEAAGRTGFSEVLDKAKNAVELAAAMADKQLDLFK